MLEFLDLVLGKLTGRAKPLRFFLFALVGCVGVLLHLAVLRTALTLLSLDFVVAQAIATLVGVTNNFFLNNLITYRDTRLTGAAILRGLLGFYAISAIGSIANLGMASWLYSHGRVWWLAGIAGAVTGALWNFSVSALFVWRAK